MSIILIALKAVMLVALALGVFAGLALALGVDPLAGADAKSMCEPTGPACLFMIF